MYSSGIIKYHLSVATNIFEMFKAVDDRIVTGLIFADLVQAAKLLLVNVMPRRHGLTVVHLLLISSPLLVMVHEPWEGETYSALFVVEHSDMCSVHSDMLWFCVLTTVHGTKELSR